MIAAMSATMPPVDDRPVRVLVVDDHAVVSLGISALLDAEHDIDVVGRAASIAEAVTCATELMPDVVLMDFRLPDGTGVDAIGELRQAGCAAEVIMLTAAADRRVLRLALEAGCLGFLSKNAAADDLTGAIRAGARGEPAFSADMLRHLARIGHTRQGIDEELTTRECEVLQLCADGLTPEEIAARLHLSHHTVRNHLRHAMAKLGAHTKLHAVVTAMQANLISVDR